MEGVENTSARAAKRTWVRPALGGLAVLAVVGITFSSIFLKRWTTISEVIPSEVEAVFDAALLEAGDGIPYIEIENSGRAVVHRDQESSHADGFDKLTLLIWNPGDGKVVRAEYPRWFVQVKTFSFVNLGTMIAAVRKDWGDLDLSVNYTDLHRRGTGLLLNHTSESGARILIWTANSP